MNGHDCILIVADRESMRQILSDILYRSGYEVLEAGGGEEALAIAATKQVDAVLTDMYIEETDEISLISKLRSIPNCQSIPILTLTNDNKCEIIEDHDKTVANFSTGKSFNPDNLIDIINEFIN